MTEQSYTSAEAARRWSLHARATMDRFGEEGDPHRIVLLNPALDELLPEVEGLHVLDAGCGEGYLSRKLARQGAHVTAVDYAQGMLALARERTEPTLDIRYLHGSCETLDGLVDGAFDLVVSNMVLMDLGDHRAALRSFYRVLAAGGLLVFSISHPCFTAPSMGWVRDEEGRKLHWKVDRYFDEGPFEQPWPPGASEGLILFHRTLSNYLRTLLRTGFELLDVIEPKPTEEALVDYPSFRDDFRMCHFIVFKAVKRSPGQRA
jgi:SAM-dependent methyltransferase